MLFMSYANGIAATVGSYKLSRLNESKKLSIIVIVEAGTEGSNLVVSNITPITAAMKGLLLSEVA